MAPLRLCTCVLASDRCDVCLEAEDPIRYSPYNARGGPATPRALRRMSAPIMQSLLAGQASTSDLQLDIHPDAYIDFSPVKPYVSQWVAQVQAETSGKLERRKSRKSNVEGSMRWQVDRQQNGDPSTPTRRRRRHSTNATYTPRRAVRRAQLPAPAANSVIGTSTHDADEVEQML